MATATCCSTQLKELRSDDPVYAIATIRTAGERAAASTTQLLVLTRKKVTQPVMHIARVLALSGPAAAEQLLDLGIALAFAPGAAISGNYPMFPVRSPVPARVVTW
jgi:hypothetical protein